MSNPANIKEIVTRYEFFINDTLKEDLKVIDMKLQSVNGEIADFTQIKKTLEILRDESFKGGFKTQVDVGCNFFIQAKIKENTPMLFNIGLNNYLEFSHEEAIKYSNARIEALEKASETLRQKSAETKAHIKLMLIGIGELQNVNAETES